MTRALAEADRFSTAAYLRAFGGLSPEAEELVDARLTSTALEDPLDDLVGSAPEHVRAWMQRKARLADGCPIGLPVCGRRALENALVTELMAHGEWIVDDGPRLRKGPELARAGLLRDLCGQSWLAIARPGDGSTAKVTRLTEVHRRLLVSDPGYAERAARVAQTAMVRSTQTIAARSRART